MSRDDQTFQNPYAPPARPPSAGRISFSRVVTEMHFAVALLVLIQVSLGCATAAVLSQETGSPRSFLTGVSLMTIVVASLAAYIGSLRITDGRRLVCWAIAVTIIAWGCFLLGIRAAGRMMSPPAVISSIDLTQFAFMAVLTTNFVVFLVKRSRRNRMALDL